MATVVQAGPVEARIVPRKPSLPPSELELFRELIDRFTVLAETCSRFSQEIYRRTGDSPEVDPEVVVRRNLEIARTVFGKWSMEILIAAYFNKSIATEDVRKSLGPISFALLKRKLRQLEKVGLIQWDGGPTDPRGARYSLTHKGTMIAHLGEPVLLYLRLADGWAKAEPSVDNR